MAEPVEAVEQTLGKVRAIALALPEAAERLSHGAPGFHIENGKFFAYFSHDHHGNGETAVLVKTTGTEEQGMLIEADPDLYYKPPYLGPSGWIAIRVAAQDTDWDHVADRIAASWEMVAPRRLLEMGGR
ncbi:phosphoribosylglycinamide formyltransferase-1/phosphoribosylamine--glycine ligase / phosphoribosylglycinamide formyltransferase / phosphoribosylformylglycinamidine cyclo-ligase [Sphingomonas sp. OV641]|uniref:MmcQ/YjbR family DNA-binding protein n=1 Tax=Sphingomonas sp. OV641 TaxID=1881068 RepID=UPI0008D2CA90|nr:MmcQ/YjbR family DNA-binding protein [Sphingomonas sp. OV641]SEJ00683.1 phosphoribosylglycinamide formyltransferase-1/phosphoribosylamine--glycine ligase / phosphoribosylglycinamide formyltransferase / phosphoribosylformylglycinamidine cyclo-ligase [Sphingomonas sp. OV641]